MKKMLLVLLPLGLLAVVGLQQRQLSHLHADREDLARAAQETGQLKAGLSQAAALPGEQDVAGEVARLREANRDLLKLRNEVRMLREQKPEYERLRAENARLRALGQTNGAPGVQFSMRAIFISKENLSQQGFLTPEATVQTFYWAQREANEEVFASCFVPDRAETLSETGSEPAHYLGGHLSDVSSIEIVTRRSIGTDTIHMGVQVHRRDRVDKIALTLKLVQIEWKLDLDPRNL